MVPEGNVRFRGSLSVVFKTPEMHISPWYWFSPTSRASRLLMSCHTPPKPPYTLFATLGKAGTRVRPIRTTTNSSCQLVAPLLIWT